MRRKNKKNTSFIFSSGFFLFILILIFAGISKITVEKFNEWKKIKEVLDLKKKEISLMKEEIDNLKKTLADLENPSYLELIIKERLNLIKEGEKVINVSQEKEDKKEDKKIEKKEEGNFLKDFLESLKQKFQEFKKRE